MSVCCRKGSFELWLMLGEQASEESQGWDSSVLLALGQR